MSNQIQNPNAKMFSKTISYLSFSVTGCQVHSFLLKAGFSLTAPQAASSSGGVALFILLDIVDEPMNGSSYAQCATPPCLPCRHRQEYLKTVQFLSVNLEPLAQTWLSSPVA
jgi:hypothetical protein